MFKHAVALLVLSARHISAILISRIYSLASIYSSCEAACSMAISSVFTGELSPVGGDPFARWFINSMSIDDEWLCLSSQPVTSDFFWATSLLLFFLVFRI